MALGGTTYFSFYFYIVKEKSDYTRRDLNPRSERS